MMKTRQLAAEMRGAFAALRSEHAEALAEAGVPWHLIGLYEMAGVGRVRVDGDYYQPDPDGGRAFISPVLIGGPYGPEAADPWRFARFGGLIDLLAWDPAQPDRWALRTGAATWLGCCAPQCFAPQQTQIWRTPLAWLCSDCTGLVILSRDRAEAYHVLAGLAGGILAEDEAHVAEIRSILARPYPAPKVRNVAALRRGQVRRAA